MKLLNTETFIRRLHNKDVAVVLVETICKQSAATVEDTVAHWLTNMDTMTPDRYSLVYRPAYQENRTIFNVGTSYFNLNNFVCFEGSSSLLFAIEQNVVGFGGLRHHLATLVVFDIKKEA